jgi:hypothetical protein
MSKAASLREEGHENKIRGGNDSHAIECLLNWGAVDDEVSRKLFLKAPPYVCHKSDSG